MAETSATCGGLDSLLEPTGPLREAQQLAAESLSAPGTPTSSPTARRRRTRSSPRRWWPPATSCCSTATATSRTTTGMMLAGAHVVYLEAYPLNEYSMYGAVPLREIKSKLLALKRAGKLDRVKMMSLTNCTFDGIVYDVERVMEECLAIKPDLVFLWDEAWFAFARFHPVYRTRTAMASAAGGARAAAEPGLQARSSRRIWPSRHAEDAQRRRPAGPSPDARPGAGPGAGLRHPVDAQDADLAAAGIDDPRLRPGLRPEGRGAVPRGLHGAHLDLAELPDPGLAGPGPPAGRAGGRRVGAAADRERHAAARRDRQPSRC